MTWQKPQGCDTNTCVEVDTEVTPGAVLVRTTGTLSNNSTIWATGDEWRAFIASAKAGQYDLPEPGVTFAEILPELLAGATVARRGWGRDRTQLRVRRSASTISHLPLVALVPNAIEGAPATSRTDWTPTPEDLGADDWYVVEAAP